LHASRENIKLELSVAIPVQKESIGAKKKKKKSSLGIMRNRTFVHWCACPDYLMCYHIGKLGYFAGRVQ